MNKVFWNKRKIAIFLCCLIACVYVFGFSYSTSKLYPDFYGLDAAQFLTIGKGWYLGKLPYVSLWDHKGPFIFWVNMVGYVIGSGNKYGISIVQMLFMSISAIGLFYISQLYKRSNLFGVLAVLLTILATKFTYNVGNNVEEYCLPFLCWSTYGLLKYLKERENECNRKEHNPLWALAYGVTFGVCLMSRVTNIAPIVGLMLVTLLLLVKDAAWKNLGLNILYGLMGILVIVVPFAIYFAVNHALGDMINGTLIHNFLYMKNGYSWLRGATSVVLRDHILDYFLHLVIWLVVDLCILRKAWYEAVGFAVAGLIEAYLYIFGWGFVQYPLVCIAQATVLLGEIILLLEKRETENLLLAMMLFAIFACYIICDCLMGNALKAIDYKNEYNVHKPRVWESLFAQIPEEDYDRFVIWGEANMQEAYLITETMPCCKYYILQDWISQSSPKLIDEIHDMYENGDAKWILADESTGIIEDVLKEKYDIYGRVEGYTLYRKLR